jgi:hypothetical protein
MSIELALQRAITEIPECVAAGYVDLSTGMLLGIKTVDSHPAEVMDILAAATADLFQGTNVLTIESLFKKARGVQDGRHYFQEIIVNSDNLVHVFIRSKSNEEHVSCFVCRKSVNLGMAITKARQSVVFLQDAAA